jgi:hypothetical protein
MNRNTPCAYEPRQEEPRIPIFRLRLPRQASRTLTALLAAAGVAGAALTGVATMSLRLFVFLSAAIPLLIGGHIVYSLAAWGYAQHASIVGAIGGAFLGFLAAGALYIFAQIAVPIALLAVAIGVIVTLSG